MAAGGGEGLTWEAGPWCQPGHTRGIQPHPFKNLLCVCVCVSLLHYVCVDIEDSAQRH